MTHPFGEATLAYWRARQLAAERKLGWFFKFLVILGAAGIAGLLTGGHCWWD